MLGSAGLYYTVGYRFVRFIKYSSTLRPSYSASDESSGHNTIRYTIANQYYHIFSYYAVNKWSEV